MSGEEPTMSSAGEVNKYIKVIEDRVTLLKTHMAEIGIYANSRAQLLSMTHEAVHRHKELLAKVCQLSSEISSLYEKNIRLLNERLQELNATGRQIGLSVPLTQEHLVREIMKAYSKNKEIKSQADKLVAEVAQLEETPQQQYLSSLYEENIRLQNERLQELNAMGRQIGLSVPLTQEQLVREIMKAFSKNKELKSQADKLVAEVAQLEETPQQQYGIIKPTAEKEILDSNQSEQKNRDQGSCSEDWPDVLDVGEIEEKNQEILAQNILETGEQAGKVCQATSDNPWPNNPPRENEPQLMFNDRGGPSRGASFEEYLKSITESVLNEDLQNQIQRECGHSWNSCGSSHSPQSDYTQGVTPNSVDNANVPPRPESVSPPGPYRLGLTKTMSCSKMSMVMAAVLGLVTDKEAKKVFEAEGDWRG